MYKIIDTQNNHIITLTERGYNTLIKQFPDFEYYTDSNILQLSSLSFINDNVEDRRKLIKIICLCNMKDNTRIFDGLRINMDDILHFYKFYAMKLDMRDFNIITKLFNYTLESGDKTMIEKECPLLGKVIVPSNVSSVGKFLGEMMIV